MAVLVQLAAAVVGTAAAADEMQIVAAVEAGIVAAADSGIVAAVVEAGIAAAAEVQFHFPCQAPPEWKWQAPQGRG